MAKLTEKELSPFLVLHSEIAAPDAVMAHVLSQLSSEAENVDTQVWDAFTVECMQGIRAIKSPTCNDVVVVINDNAHYLDSQEGWAQALAKFHEEDHECSTPELASAFAEYSIELLERYGGVLEALDNSLACSYIDSILDKMHPEDKRDFVEAFLENIQNTTGPNSISNAIEAAYQHWRENHNYDIDISNNVWNAQYEGWEAHNVQL